MAEVNPPAAGKSYRGVSFGRLEWFTRIKIASSLRLLAMTRQRRIPWFQQSKTNSSQLSFINYQLFVLHRLEICARMLAHRALLGPSVPVWICPQLRQRQATGLERLKTTPSLTAFSRAL